MPELLLEVGCEELPATFVRKAYTDLLSRVCQALGEQFGQEFSGAALGTPRRLIVSIPDLPERQPDSTKEVRGPALKAAYDAEGKPSPALLGFCRSNGAEPDELRKDEQYVWLTKFIVGMPTHELLADLLPKAIKGLSFDKSMRWGSARLRFARPIRWLLAAYGGKAVEFEIEGVWAGLDSRGHRFYSPEPFEAATLEALLSGLRARKVEPDVAARIESIKSQAHAVADGTPELPDELVDENAFLTEWPTAIMGTFRDEHLGLPAPVLTTAMAKHEKMFPVRDANGALMNRFVFIRNSGEDDSVRRGAEWVLNARLDDAQFFYREDKKHSLDYFLEKTSGIVFHAQLGTVRDRADRLSALAGSLANFSTAIEGADHRSEAESAALAGKFAKADLSTGLVSDMASLQGIVGGEYSRRAELPEDVCWAISTQYNHTKNLGPTTSAGRVANYLVVADNLDKLAGYLGLGLMPTGSSDPFGLRRSAQVLIDVALNWLGSSTWDFGSLFQVAVQGYAAHKFEPATTEKALEELFRARYTVHFDGQRYDVVEAATASDVLKPQVVRARIELLTRLTNDIPFVQAATRPINIVAAAKKTGWSPAFGDRTFEEIAAASGTDAAKPLAEACAAFSTRDESGLRALVGPVGPFMDSTMINVEDQAQRSARLELLAFVAHELTDVAGDFSKLVIEG